MPARVVHRRIRLPAGATMPIEPGAWDDTLIVVLAGRLELICRSGRRACFTPGAVLTLAGVPVRTLRNPGREPLVLHLVRRHR